MDSLGNLTAGVGHKMTSAEKAKYPEGTKIPKAVRDKWLKEDVAKAEKWSKEIIAEKIGEDVPEEVESILFNMAFNLGKTGLSKFTKTLEFIKQREYVKASEEMLASYWSGQVGYRANRLSERMRNVK